MTLIKMYFVGSLRALVADVTKRISEKVCGTLPCVVHELMGYIREFRLLLSHIYCIRDLQLYEVSWHLYSLNWNVVR